MLQSKKSFQVLFTEFSTVTYPSFVISVQRSCPGGHEVGKRRTFDRPLFQVSLKGAIIGRCEGVARLVKEDPRQSSEPVDGKRVIVCLVMFVQGHRGVMFVYSDGLI